MNLSLCSFFADDHCHSDSRICHRLLSGPLCSLHHSFCFLFCYYFLPLSPFRFSLHSVLPGSLACHLNSFQQHFPRPLGTHNAPLALLQNVLG